MIEQNWTSVDGSVRWNSASSLNSLVRYRHSDPLVAFVVFKWRVVAVSNSSALHHSQKHLNFFFLTSTFRATVTLYSKTAHFSSGITSVLGGENEELTHMFVIFFFSTQTVVKKEYVRIYSLLAAVVGEFWAMWLSASYPTRIGKSGLFVSFFFFFLMLCSRMQAPFTLFEREQFC